MESLLGNFVTGTATLGRKVPGNLGNTKSIYRKRDSKDVLTDPHTQLFDMLMVDVSMPTAENLGQVT